MTAIIIAAGRALLRRVFPSARGGNGAALFSAASHFITRYRIITDGELCISSTRLRVSFKITHGHVLVFFIFSGVYLRLRPTHLEPHTHWNHQNGAQENETNKRGDRHFRRTAAKCLAASWKQLTKLAAAANERRTRRGTRRTQKRQRTGWKAKTDRPRSENPRTQKKKNSVEKPGRNVQEGRHASAASLHTHRTHTHTRPQQKKKLGKTR